METLARCILSLLVVALALLPTWAFLLIRYVAEPHGFWQNLILFGVGIWFLGTFQIICLVFGIALFIAIWTS